MDNVPKTRLVRQYIRNSLQSLGGSDPSPVTETLLIRDGIYCGHRFQRSGYVAVWFVEENQVKLYGPVGELLESWSADDVIDKQVLRAA